MRNFIDRVKQKHQPPAVQQIVERRELRAAPRPFLRQPVARRRQGFAGAERAIAVERDEEAQRPGLSSAGAQRIDGEVEFEPAQQRALAAAGRAEQYQCRLTGLAEHLAQVAKRLLLRLPARSLGVRALVEQQRQPREALVERVARLRPFGNPRQSVLFERTRRVAEDLLQLVPGKFGDCLASEQRCAEIGQVLRQPREAGRGRRAPGGVAGKPGRG